MKFDLVARLGLSIALAIFFFAGCMQSAKDQDYQPMEMAQEAEVQSTEAPQEQIPTTLPAENNENLEAQLSTDTNTRDEAPEEESPAPIPKTQAMGTDPLVTTPLPEPTPAVARNKKVKALKSEVKFKVSKKASAKAVIVDDGKGVQITFSTSKMKKNTYTLMVEKSCKGKKTKGIKAAQFKVKDGVKFSGKTTSKTISLRSGNSKFAGKKALALYMGAKANVRVACEMIKVK